MFLGSFHGWDRVLHNGDGLLLISFPTVSCFLFLGGFAQKVNWAASILVSTSTFGGFRLCWGGSSGGSCARLFLLGQYSSSCTLYRLLGIGRYGIWGTVRIQFDEKKEWRWPDLARYLIPLFSWDVMRVGDVSWAALERCRRLLVKASGLQYSQRLREPSRSACRVGR